MVNPTKYDDFLEHDRVVKQYHDTDVEFVQYKCPLEGCAPCTLKPSSWLEVS